MTHVRTQGQGTRIALGGVYSLFVTLTAGLALAVPSGALAAITCARTLTADVVVFDQPLMYNRLGAQNVNGIMYALRRDVVSKGSLTPCGAACVAGNVTLRPDKRPRPLVLRVAAGDCLQVKFQNLLTALANPSPVTPGFTLPKVDNQVASRMAGFHAQGMQLVNVIGDDSSWVGAGGSSLAATGAATTYNYFAEKEGAFLVTSHGATFGSDGSAGNSANGMFAVINVEPPGASFYRSQVTEEEMRLCTTGSTDDGQPILNYEATYPAVDATGADSVWALEGKAGLPVLNMLQGTTLVHSDLNAVIANSDPLVPTGKFPPATYPLESVGKVNPTVPNRLEPFREYTVASGRSSKAVPGSIPLSGSPAAGSCT